MRFSSTDRTGLVGVLSLLKSHDSEYLSGQDLSDVLKISRVAVWKHITRIRELGYGVESRQKLGYKLESDTGLPLPWEVAHGLDTKIIGRRMHYFTETDSTQDRAAAMAAGGEPNGTVIIAQKQSAGRGRGGRRWLSPEGGIWLSVILRPKFDVAAMTLFPLAASLALSTAIKRSLGIQTGLKWPNDLTLRGRKVAGMLVDASIESNKIASMILGAGINFDIDAGAAKAQLDGTPGFYGVASLAGDAGPTPKALVRAFLEDLEGAYLQLDAGRTDEIVRGWTRHSSTLGRNVSISTARGVLRGKAVRIDHDGALVIAAGRKNTRVTFGDVVHA